MCSGVTCGIITTVVGAVLVIASCIFGFVLIHDVVENTIINEVILLNDTVQLERFKEVPFPLNFRARVFNITNALEVLQGAVPEVAEVGPYCYRLYQQRVIQSLQEDRIVYRRLDHFEFDAECSYPYTEDDTVQMANVAYHGVIQVAYERFPELMGALNLAMGGVFGARNSPVATIRVGDLLFDGIRLCEQPGFVSGFVCSLIRTLSADIQNMATEDDNTMSFSVLKYRNGNPGTLHEAKRGIDNHLDLGRLTAFDSLPELRFWSGAAVGQAADCNTISGTDSGVFNPFINTDEPLYVLNTDICRTVRLVHQFDTEHAGIPLVRFSANEWFLDNDEGCYCLNVTRGVTRENGCLLRGAMEMYSCVGAYMVFSYPHFLFADPRYRNGVVGMTPRVEDHRLFLDLEPNTGTVVRAAKRAQFNMFMRPVPGIPATQNLRTTLTPILWLEETMELSEEYTDMLNDQLLSTLSLVNILVPVAVAISCVVLLTGITIVICTRSRKRVD